MSRNLNKLLDIRSLKMLDNYAQFNPVPLSIGKSHDRFVRKRALAKYLPVPKCSDRGKAPQELKPVLNNENIFTTNYVMEN